MTSDTATVTNPETFDSEHNNTTLNSILDIVTAMQSVISFSKFSQISNTTESQTTMLCGIWL